MYVFVFFLVVIILIYKFKDYKFEYKTILKKGLPPIDDRHGVYFVTGRQGSGKNFYSIKLLLQQNPKKVNYIKTNVHSLHIPGYEIKYFTKITEIYQDIDENCIYLIDEVSRKWDRNSRTDTQFYAWLNQARKRKRIVILITQEWRELPMWIRRPAKYMLSTKPFGILGRFGIYCTTIGDAENMVYDKDEGEYNCPPILHRVYKRTKDITNYYDTFEPINEL